MENLDPAHFRHAVSRFTTGVTIVTSRDEKAQVVGMTANSFMSVSLKPPMILVSLMNGRTLKAIKQSGKLAVNVLPANAKDISCHFSGKLIPGYTPNFEETALMPKLKSAIAYFECEIEKIILVEDHTLVIGKVMDCSYKDEEPLVFFSSQYHKLEGEIRTKP